MGFTLLKGNILWDIDLTCFDILNPVVTSPWHIAKQATFTALWIEFRSTIDLYTIDSRDFSPLSCPEYSQKGDILLFTRECFQWDLSWVTLMSFICSKCKQTTTRNAQQSWKAFLLAKTEITVEPALVLKLDYARKWIYAEEVTCAKHVRRLSHECKGEARWKLYRWAKHKQNNTPWLL